MTRFEFKILQLKEQPGHSHRMFAWESSCGCHRCPPENLATLLNQLGAEGWSASVLGASDRNPHSLILQRPLTDDAPEPQAVRSVRAPYAVKPIPDPQLTALVEEMHALRVQLARQPVPQVTVQPAPVHVAPTINLEVVQAQLEAMLISLRALELGQPAAAQALRAAIETTLTPQLIRMPSRDYLIPQPETTPWWRVLFQRLGFAGGA